MITPATNATEKGSLAVVQKEAVDKGYWGLSGCTLRPASLVDAQP